MKGIDPGLTEIKQALSAERKVLDHFWHDKGQNQCSNIAHHHDPEIDGYYVAAGANGKELHLVTHGERDARIIFVAPAQIKSIVVLNDGALLVAGEFKRVFMIEPTDDDLYLECGSYDSGAQTVQ